MNKRSRKTPITSYKALNAQEKAGQFIEYQLQQLREKTLAEQQVASQLQQAREKALAERVVAYQLQQAREKALAEQQVAYQLQRLRQIYEMQPPPQDAQITLLPSEEEEYDKISDFSFSGSGSGSSVPSDVAKARDNMPIKKKISSMKKHQTGKNKAQKINKVALRGDRDSPQGNTRASPTRALMPAYKLSKTLVGEHPFQEQAQYRSDELRRKFGWGKTKRKKRRKPKTKRKYHTKNHRKKRKFTRRK